MIALQGLDDAMPFSHRPNALGCGKGCRERGDVWDLVPDRRFADIGIVVLAQPSARCVDHQVDLAVLDGIYSYCAI